MSKSRKTLISLDGQIVFTMEIMENFHDDKKLGEAGFDTLYKVI